MELFQNRFCHSVWLQVIWLTHLTHFLVDLILHKLYRVSKESLHLKTNQTTTNQVLEVGLWKLETSCITENLFITMDKLKLIQLLLILEVLSSLFHLKSIILFLINGRNRLKDWIALLMQHSVKLPYLVMMLLHRFRLFNSILKILFLKCNQCHTFIKEKEFANLLLQKIHLTNLIVEITFLEICS